MASDSHHPTFVRSVALVSAFILIAGSCGSTTSETSSSGDAASPTTALQGPPSGTLPPLVAPPRSATPVFSGEAAEVEQAFTDLLDAFDRMDATAAVALYSNPAPSLRDDLVSFMGNFQLLLYRINAIEVEGDAATIEYEDAIVSRPPQSAVNTLLEQREVWTKADGSWKRVSGDASAPGIPVGLMALTAELPDGAPISLPSALTSGDFAFLLKNTGSVTKGVFIMGIPADFDIEALLPIVAKAGVDRDNGVAVRYPDGVIELGATPDIPAQQDGTMVFNGLLPEGRYVLFSRTSSDGDPAPTLLPNEYAEFTVG